MYLAELLIQITRLGKGWQVSFSVIHRNVPLNELGLEELDYFHSDKERDWDHTCIEEEPSAHVGEKRFEVNANSPFLSLRYNPAQVTRY